MSTPSTTFPQQSLEECHQILTGPGMPWEMTTAQVGKHELRVYKNAPPTLRAFWLAVRAYGGKDYIVYEDERFTYEQAHQVVERYASFLYHQLGCRKGDRIAICSRNLPEWIWVFWATQLIGAVTVAVNAWLPADSLRHCLTFTTPRVVFLDGERSPLVAPMMSDLDAVGGTRFVYSFRDPKAPSFGMNDFAQEIKAWDPEGKMKIPEVKTLPDDVATIYFTSGTTGLPKGVVGTSRQYLHNVVNSSFGGARMFLRRGEAIPTPDPNEPQKSTLLAVPLFHAMGNHSAVGLGTAMGIKIVMIRKWDAEAAATLVIKENISSAGGIPFMANEIVAALHKRGVKDLLESVSYGGAPSSAGLPSQIERVGAMPSQGYGATEVSSMATSVVGEDYLLRPTTCGLPCPVVDIKIVDPTSGKELAVGQHGEILIAGPGRTNGYWRNAKATQEAFTDDGFYRTGDVGYLDQDGFVYISDRVKDLIIRGGENISSVSVETEIYRDERVLDCAVIGVPDDKFGELVAAAVVPKPEHVGKISEEELLQFVKTKLPKHSVPVIIVFLDGLPRNGVGKTDKKILRTEVSRKWEERKKERSKL